MPPPLLIDTSEIDLSKVELSQEQVYELIPQRHEFMVLGGVCLLDPDNRSLVAFADVRPDDWWVRGHIPDRPLFPGVLMLEAAAQAAAVAAKLFGKHDGFMGFGGVEKCKFRDVVLPPARLHILAVGEKFRPRRFVCKTQGLVEGRLVFEAEVTGVAVR